MARARLVQQARVSPFDPSRKTRGFPCSLSATTVRRLLLHYLASLGLHVVSSSVDAAGVAVASLPAPSWEPLAPPPLMSRSTPCIPGRCTRYCGQHRRKGGWRRSGGCMWRSSYEKVPAWPGWSAEKKVGQIGHIVLYQDRVVPGTVLAYWTGPIRWVRVVTQARHTALDWINMTRLGVGSCHVLTRRTMSCFGPARQA